MKEVKIPTLEPDDIEVKVKQITQKGALALLYKTARTDMEYLDKCFGIGNWQCDYREIKGNLYCSIDIWDDEKNTWVHKVDCGIESREDDEGNQKKGEASDAFKRAGFKIGIGRELYSSPFIWLSVKTEQDKNGRWQLSDRFAKYVVTDIGYDNKRKINKLVISNEKTGEVVYKYGTGNDVKKPTTPSKAQTKQPKAQVTTSDTMPVSDDNYGEKAFKDFLAKHSIEKTAFVAMRADAIKAGKEVSAKSFKEMSQDEWVVLIHDMEMLYTDGFFKDVA